MSKNQELDKLFDLWEKEIIEYNGFFKRDGIFDETIFAEQKKNGKATLFLAIEGNDPSQKMYVKDDYRTWWIDKIKDKSQKRIGSWSFGVLKNFPQYEDACNDTNTLLGLKSVSFINIKKSGGSSKPDIKAIYGLTQNTKQFLKDEISIIDPDIIIGGLKKVPHVWEILFGIEFKDWIYTENNLRITSWEGVKIIDFYHPSHRKSPREVYYRLQKTFESKLFVNL